VASAEPKEKDALEPLNQGRLAEATVIFPVRTTGAVNAGSNDTADFIEDAVSEQMVFASIAVVPPSVGWRTTVLPAGILIIEIRLAPFDSLNSMDAFVRNDFRFTISPGRGTS
jgi:hypothetical protein